MSTFTLTTQSPDDVDYDERPATLMPLRDWLERFRAGALTWRPEWYGGVGVRLRDGASEYLEERWGSAEHMVPSCIAAADRLADGRVALLRTCTDGPGSYLVLVPREGIVRAVHTLEQPPLGAAFPYQPSFALGETPADLPALYAWAETNAERLLAPSGKPAFDRRSGKDLRLPLDELIRDLRSEAEVAREVHALGPG